MYTVSKRFLWAVFVCFSYLYTTAVFGAEISVTTDRDPVGLNESFQLIFASDGNVGEPDFSPLEQNFQILSRNESSNMSIMNGSVTNSKTWRLAVLARRTGRLTIPSILFGNERSLSSVVTVNDSVADNGQLAADQGILLEVEATPTDPYVQSQVIYKVRLLLSVAVSNASLSEPEVDGAAAILEKNGDDVRYQTRRNGKRYDVIERSYAIYPQTSGAISIEPLVFQAQSGSRSGFFGNPFNTGARTLVVRSEAVTLDVRPIPTAFTGRNWLPASKVTLTESWSEDPPEYSVGEPLTRTLTLSAEGVTASQLPELPGWNTSAIKQYPDMPSLNNQLTQSGITGHRTERIAMIPNQAGDYTLPAISIPWWNTTTDRQEYARLPERHITVDAPVADPRDQQAGMTPVPLADHEVAAPVAEEVMNADLEPAGSESPGQYTTRYWQWLSLGLFITWLVTLLLWWRMHQRASGHADTQDHTQSLRQITAELQQACKDNDAAAARELLLQWGHCVWPDNPPGGTAAIAARCGNDLAREIDTLNKVLFGRNSAAWDGARFLKIFKAEQVPTGGTKDATAGQLEPLYRI
jgi:hypothetical protein